MWLQNNYTMNIQTVAIRLYKHVVANDNYVVGDFGPNSWVILTRLQSTFEQTNMHRNATTVVILVHSSNTCIVYTS